MSILFEERPSDSLFVEKVMCGRTISAGAPTRPAETNWHMVFSRHEGNIYPIVVGPWTSSGVVEYGGEAEILWIKFKLGTFMPHMPTRKIIDSENILPQAAFNKFWLKGSAWQLPDYENADTFVERLVRDEILVCDPIVKAVLEDQPADAPSRTIRHRFSQATGLSQNHIFQFERAQRAVKLLEQGVPILDTVDAVGYYDQPHLTRSLKRFIGYTPAQILTTEEGV